MKCSYITPIHKTVDVILELRACTRIDAHVSGTLEIREMCPQLKLITYKNGSHMQPIEVRGLDH